MAERIHFIDVPSPDVVWALAGSSSGPVPQPPMSRAKVGDVVAGVAGTGGAAIAPVAGEIGQPAPRIDSRGTSRWAVPLIVDDEPGEASPRDAMPPLGRLGREDLPVWIERLEAAGARANRHNSPDLGRQLVAAIKRPIDVVLCHTLEADPTLPIQVQWALRHAPEFHEGLQLLGRLVGARRVVVAVAERNMRRVTRRLRRLGERKREARGDQVQTISGLRLLSVDNTYPQADPTLLVKTVLNRRLLPGALPTDAGVLMLDAVAAVAVGQVARSGRSILREPVAIRDHRHEISVLAQTRRGSRLCDVLMFLGLMHHDPEHAPEAARALQVVAGDYLRSQEVPADIVLDGGENVFHVEAHLPVAIPDPCIRCGWCLDICPTGVHPAGALEAAQSRPEQRERLGRKFGVHACIGCGLCTFVCPSRLPLRAAALEVRDRPR